MRFHCPKCNSAAEVEQDGEATAVCVYCGCVFDAGTIPPTEKSQGRRDQDCEDSTGKHAVDATNAHTSAPRENGEATRSSHAANDSHEWSLHLGNSHTSFGPKHVIGNFHLIQLLGQGAFGSVWLAEDQKLGRRVALKLPKPRRSDDALLHEARTAAKLNHSNIVSIFEVGMQRQQVYIASEYIEGSDLQELLAQGRLEQKLATRLVEKLALAVEHAHRHGIVHRDLKPANILIDSDGEPHIADFGIAKQLDAQETISTDGAIVGTIKYMSPEQAKGQTRTTDHRSDVYSLGVILFEMLTEYCPFRGNARAIMHQKVYEDAPSPRRLAPNLDRDLETICLKCLEREPANRYASAQALAEELARYRTGEPIHARPIGRPEKTWRWCKRNKAVATLLAAILMTLATGAMSTTFFWMRAERQTLRAQASLHRAKMNAAAEQWVHGDYRSLRRSLTSFEAQGELHGLSDFAVAYYQRRMSAYAHIVQHSDSVVSISMSDDGRLFAAAGLDRAISVWNSDDGSLVRTLPPQASKIVDIQFQPRGRRLIAAHANGAMHFWNPSQHDRILTSIRHDGPLTAIAFSPNGRALLSAGRRSLWRWSQLDTDAPSSEPLELPSDLKPIVAAACTEQHGAIATWSGASQDGQVIIMDLDGQQVIHNIATPTVQSIAYGADENVWLAGAYNGRLWRIDMESGKASSTHLTSTPIGDVAPLWGTKLLAVASLQPSLMLLEDDRVTRRYYGPRFSFGMLAQSKHRDRRYLISSGGDNAVNVLRVEGIRKPESFWRPTHVRSLCFLSDSQLLAADGDGKLTRIDLFTHEEASVDLGGRELLAMAYCAQNRQLYVGGMLRELVRFGAEAPAPLSQWQRETLPLNFAGVSDLCCSANGSHVLCGARNGALLGYTGVQTEPVFQLQRPNCSVNAIAHNGRGGAQGRFAVAYSDRVIQVFNEETLKGSKVGFDEGRLIELEFTPTAVSYCEGSVWQLDRKMAESKSLMLRPGRRELRWTPTQAQSIV